MEKKTWTWKGDERKWMGDGSIDLVFFICHHFDDDRAQRPLGRHLMGTAVRGSDGLEKLMNAIVRTTGRLGQVTVENADPILANACYGGQESPYSDIELFRRQLLKRSCQLTSHSAEKSFNLYESSKKLRLGRILSARFTVRKPKGRWKGDGLGKRLGSDAGWIFGHEGGAPCKSDFEGWDRCCRGACLEEVLSSIPEEVKSQGATILAIDEGRERGFSRDDYPSSEVIEMLIGKGGNPDEILRGVMGYWHLNGVPATAREWIVATLLKSGARPNILWEPGLCVNEMSWMERQEVTGDSSVEFLNELKIKKTEWERSELDKEGAVGTASRKARL